MAQLTATQRNLGKIASFLGTIQGLAWTTMSLICIIQYNQGNPPEELCLSTSSYMDIFNCLLYFRFLDKIGQFESSVIITPKAFTVFMWIYLLVDLLWIAVSLLQFDSINKGKQNVSVFLKYWGVVTSCIACIDFLLICFIGADYDQCMDGPATVQEVCTTIMIPVLVIAAKGFVLWIINVIFIYIAYKITKELRNKTERERRLL